MRETAHDNGFCNSEREQLLGILRHNANDTGYILLRHGGQGLTEQADTTLLWSQDPPQHLQ
jgi:hypothetical protein